MALNSTSSKLQALRPRGSPGGRCRDVHPKRMPPRFQRSTTSRIHYSEFTVLYCVLNATICSATVKWRLCAAEGTATASTVQYSVPQ